MIVNVLNIIIVTTVLTFTQQCFHSDTQKFSRQFFPLTAVESVIANIVVSILYKKTYQRCKPLSRQNMPLRRVLLKGAERWRLLPSLLLKSTPASECKCSYFIILSPLCYSIVPASDVKLTDLSTHSEHIFGQPKQCCLHNVEAR